jgi:periplasmic divalent cation tolerance protein
MLWIMCNAPASAAEPLAMKLLEHRYAACVNIVPNVRSLYWWNGNIQDETECTLWIKTTEAREADVRRAITKVHPYEVPEILVIEVDDNGVHPPYLAWVHEQTKPVSSPRSAHLPAAGQVTPPPPESSKK